MPRKQFMADLDAVIKTEFPGITKITKGDDDNEVVACFLPVSGPLIEMTILALDDVSSYPTEHRFMIFTQSSDVSPAATAALERVSESSFGLKLLDLATAISEKLSSALAIGARNDLLFLDDSDVEMIDEPEVGEFEGDAEDEGDDEEEEEYEDPYDSDLGFESYDGQSRKLTSTTLKLTPETAKNLNKRIRHDLRTAKFGGFSVGVLSGMKAESVSSLLSLSIRVSKLGISEEALQAWDLEPEQYFVLLFRYSNGYKTFDAVADEPAKSVEVAFRVGVCKRYKPTFDEALAAFTDTTKDTGNESNNKTEEDVKEKTSGFTNLFISSSLNDFMNDQFVSLLKIRSSLGLGWDGAKRWYNDKQSRIEDSSATIPATYLQESTPLENPLFESVLSDHLADHDVTSASFPLLAAQFALRYFVRCTDFCLVCHDLIETEEKFGAIKPYVCDKPLCLYQYMSLGFGPSVEHEILTQPYVVDLLVSFCYTAAMYRKLRSRPIGMSLAVPPVLNSTTQDHLNRYVPSRPTPSANATPVSTASLLDISFDASRHEILFGQTSQPCPVRNGDWVAIEIPGRNTEHHRVEDISLFPVVRVSELAVTRSTTLVNTNPPGTSAAVPATPATTPPPPVLLSGKLVIYRENFDDMNDVEKDETVVMLLETLPSLREMRSYLLQQSQRATPSLRTWKERISPAALGILRWIIASNRSCIVQVDKCPGQEEIDGPLSKIRLDQRLSNVAETWVQFRFAQGSPDKEQKFLNALREQDAKGLIDHKYPTLFAFHGSAMHNWHSIIRTGLDWGEIANGRAYGNGVYHAQDQTTSVHYSQASNVHWHGSSLRISNAMSVNEIVNCPAQFQSSTPYLVVQHVDWIQCRYLLVSSSSADVYDRGGASNPSSTTASQKPDPKVEVEQDPKRTATSTLNKPLGIPLCAVSISRAFKAKAQEPTPSKKRRKQVSSVSTLADTAMSESESLSDIEFFFSDGENPGPVAVEKPKSKLTTATSTALTDFVAGSLDQSTLPLLQPPSYASPAATKTLSRALKDILAVQEKTPLNELGWYINEKLINNLYQWIVELHSFEASLPLAEDMKKAGVSSIVLEIRFGNDYPFSPPFVRVIRPRFLPFTQGGGGHVTAGGAMCMELLTNTGWSSVSTIESVLLQVRMAIMNLEPRPARLESHGRQQMGDYGTFEAIEAYKRACAQHGWQVPPGFGEFAQEIAGPSNR